MASRIFFGNQSSARTIALSPVVVEVSLPAVTVLVPRTFALAPVVVEVTIPAVTVATVAPPINISLVPVVVEVTVPAVAVSYDQAIALAPVVVEATVPAITVLVTPGPTISLSPVVVAVSVPAVTVNSNPAPTIPSGGTARVGLISDRPQITYDGSGLINRIIPFGVNYDGSDLTLQYALPAQYPYPIKHDGDAWYIEDTASIALYGLYEQKVYRSDVKVPPTHDNSATGQPGQPTGLNQQLLTIGAACTAGDLISFTWLGVTYTYTFASSPGNGEIGIASTAGEQQQLILSAFAGADGHNLNYGVVALGSFYNNIAVINASQRGDIGISATFTDAANYLGGGQADSDPPATSPPATAPTELGGGDLGTETANVLYALAVNTLIKQRSEILGLRVVVANGADIWALPGDRMQVKYRGIADTAESLAVNGNSRVVWLDIDEPMLVVERHDRSDPSGIRQVEFMLAAPTIQYAVPPLPTWTDPVALPVPANTGSFPGTDATGAGDTPPFEGYTPGDYTPPDIPPYTPAADWVADTLGSILTGNKLPFPSCCPDPTTDITSGTNLLPPPQVAMVEWSWPFGSGSSRGRPLRGDWVLLISRTDWGFYTPDPGVVTDGDAYIMETRGSTALNIAGASVKAHLGPLEFSMVRHNQSEDLSASWTNELYYNVEVYLVFIEDDDWGGTIMGQGGDVVQDGTTWTTTPEEYDIGDITVLGGDFGAAQSMLSVRYAVTDTPTLTSVVAECDTRSAFQLNLPISSSGDQGSLIQGLASEIGISGTSLIFLPSVLEAEDLTALYDGSLLLIDDPGGDTGGNYLTQTFGAVGITFDPVASSTE
jgi:hypothetical protein